MDFLNLYSLDICTQLIFDIFQPKLVVDAATLTGAMAVAIGGAAAGVYSTRFHELPSKVIFIKIRLSYMTISNVILDHICAKDYNFILFGI